MYGYLAAVLCLLVAAIRFVIHPTWKYFKDDKGLRKFPNMSTFSGISSLPYMLVSRSGKRSDIFTERHKTEPILRVGPNALSFGQGQAIKAIYGHGSPCTKDDLYSVSAGTHFHLADVVDKTHHAQKRKVLSSAYAVKNLEDWEYKIADKISNVVAHFDSCCSENDTFSGLTVDYRAWTNFFTMDAIADIGVSEKLGFTLAGDDAVPSEGLDGTIRTAHYRESLHSLLTVQSHIIWSYEMYPWLAKITQHLPWYRKLWKLGSSYDGIVYHQAKKRFQRYLNHEKLDDFFQALMENKDGSIHNLEWGEIVAELSIMLNAGSVSTAVAINNVMYYLLKNPDKLAILREEVDSVLTDEVVAPYDRVRHLPYLRACIDEAMRLLPPTPFNLPRKTPPEGIFIGDAFIPGNTTVGISSHVVHRDTQIFPNPESFVPERWLGEAGKELQPYFLTFSAGARGCIGRNISYLEQYMITATMVHRYEFALPHKDWVQSRYEHFNQNPGPLPIRIRRRQVGRKE